MALVNEHFLKLPNNYLFSDIAKKVNAFKVSHPKTDLIRLGIGDVTRPLPQASIEAMHKAVDELANKETFHGYGPEQGYDFLIDAVIRNDYAPRGVYLEPGEVFISDGAKSDTGNIGDILRHDNSIGVTDPIYLRLLIPKIIRAIIIFRRQVQRITSRQYHHPTQQYAIKYFLHNPSYLLECNI